MSLEIPKATSASRERAGNRSLLEYANQNRGEGFFNDVNIKVANECFPANRMVLSCFSRVFERMFKVEMKERYEQTVEVKQVDEKSMKIVIDYIYTGHIDIDNENVMDLLAAADYLQLDEMKQFCCDFLISVLSLNTWYAIFTASERYNNDPLRLHLRQYFSTNLDEVSRTNEFKALPKYNLIALVENLDRSKLEESSVYQAFVVWTKANETERKLDFPDLLQSVKFHKISGEFCDEVISEEKLVVENVQSLKLVFHAFSKKLKFSSNMQSRSKIVSFGGHYTLTQCFEVMNLGNEEAQNYPKLPIPLHKHNALKLNDFVFCIGGESRGVSSKRVWKMNFTKLNPQWQEVASLNESRCGFAAAVFHDLLIAAGGSNSNSVEIYMTAFDEWKLISPMNEARFATSLVRCAECVYAVGGCARNGLDLASVERLSNLKGKWEYVESMQTSRRFHAAVSCNGCIYAIGGRSADKRLKSVEKYDPEINKWSYVSNMSTERSGVAACVMNGKIYATGGLTQSGSYAMTIECYDPQKDIWSSVYTTNAKLQQHSVVTI